MNNSIIHIDVRDLPAPGPLEQVLALLARSHKNDIICMLHRHTPCALFNILKSKGYCYSVIEKNDFVEIYIWNTDNLSAPDTIEEKSKEK